MPKVLIAAAILGVISTSPVHAKKEENVPPPECPLDTIIRTANPQLLKNFTVLSGCAKQIVVAQAAPEEFQPDEQAYDESDQASLSSDRWPEQFAIERGGAPIQTSAGTSFAVSRSFDGISSKPLAANSDSVSVSGSPYSVVYPARKGARYAYPGSGAIISIKAPPQDFRPIDLTTQPIGGSFDFSSKQANFNGSGQTSAISGSAILVMRPQTYRTQYDTIISDTALRHRIDPLFLHAVIKQESGYRATVASHAGARGLMQIMPATGRSLGVDPSNLNNATINVDAGARLLRKLYFKYSGNFDLVLAAYNAGEGAVQKYGNRIPPYKETQNYVRSVMAIYYKLLSEQNGLVASK